MKFSPQQFKEIGRSSFRLRLREVVERKSGQPVPPGFDQTVNPLIHRAGLHGLVTEQQVAAFCLVAWQLGSDFDTRFRAARNILASDGLSADGRAQALLVWSAEMLDAL